MASKTKAKIRKEHTHHFKATAKDEIALELKYPDSIYDMRLFLARDGRKRGLWIFLEEAWKPRIENDSRQFQRGMDEFLKYLKQKKFNFEKDLKPEQMFDLAMSMKMHFDYAFGHRTESSAIRMSWRKSKMLARALNREHRAEKNKMLEDYDDAYPKEAAADEARGDDEDCDDSE